jgi:multidrug resistance protein
VGTMLALVVIAFVDMLGVVMIVPLLPFYATRMGASGTIVGVLVAAFSVAQLLSAPTWGRFSDRRGRRPALLAGLAVSAIGYLLFAGAHTLVVLLVSRVVQGFGGGTVGVINAAIADSSTPEERTKSIGWLTASTSLGAVVGPVIGSATAQAFGRAAPGVVAAALCVANLLYALVALRETRLSTAEFEARRKGGRRSGVVLREVLRRPADTPSRLVWIYTLGIGAFYGMIAVFPLYLARVFGVTEATIGYFIMFFGAVGVIVRLGILGRLVAWLGEVRLCRVGLLLLTAGLATFPLPRNLALLFAVMLLMPLGTALTFPAVTALLSRVASSAERGVYLGVQQALGGVARVALPVWTGFAIDRFGAGSPFWCGAVLAAAGLALALGIPTQIETASHRAVVSAEPAPVAEGVAVSADEATLPASDQRTEQSPAGSVRLSG